MKLNLGCGVSRIDGFVNVDIDPSVNPDAVFDFTRKLPYESETVEEVVAYHVFEHLPKANRDYCFEEIYRILKPEGKFSLSFPEWGICAENYKNNFKGDRDFWEATLYGRQASSFDFHVCIMERKDVARHLIHQGFEITYCGPEGDVAYNSVIHAVKRHKFTYQEAMTETLGI